MPQPLINITRKQAMVFALFLVLYEFLTYIANDMIMPAMIHVVQSFNVSEIYIATSLSMYVLGGASLQLLLGPISDRFGRRPVMLFGAAFFFICTVLIAFSGNITYFIVMRFLEGMGLCFISVIGYAVIQEIFSELDAVRLIAVMTNVAVIAPLLGPLAGAFLANFLSWHYIFIIIAAFSLLALWGLWKYMPEPVGATKRDGEIIARSGISLKDVSRNYKLLFTDLRFMLGALTFGFLSITCLTWIGLAPTILVTDAGLTLVEYGEWQVPVFGAFILANFILIKLTYKVDLKKLALIGGCIAFIGVLSIFLLPIIFGNNFIWLMPGVIIYFFGFGFCASPIYRLTLYTTKVTKGTASALLSMIYMSIQGISLEVANMVYAIDASYLGIFCMIVAVIFMVMFIVQNRLKSRL
ncbi:MAG: MFS transporter [Legionellaceae bacterium]|nr:MFS transporter [Legionellaceae bacterium]